MTTEIADKKNMTPLEVAIAADLKLAELRGSLPDHIDNDDDAKHVNEIMGTVSRMGKALDSRRKEILAPSKEYTDDVNAKIQPIIKAFDALKKHSKKLLVNFQRERDEIERKRIAEEKRKQDEEATRLMEEAIEKENESGFIAAVEADRLAKEAESVSSREVLAKPAQRFDQRALKTSWRAEVIDVLEVPAMYMIPDQKALDALARENNGLNAPPGVKFEEKI